MRFGSLGITVVLGVGMTVAAFSQSGTQASGTASSQTSAAASTSGAQVNSTTSLGANAQGATQSQEQSGRKNGHGKMAKERRSGEHSIGAGASGNASGAATLDAPAGTQILMALTKSLDAKKARVGDEVVARTTADVISQGKIVIPKGSKVFGHVTESKAKAKGDSGSALGLVFDRAKLKGDRIVSFQSAIQAVAGPARAAASDEGMADVSQSSIGAVPANNSGGGTGSPLGGAVGGATSTLGAAGGQIGRAAGDTAGDIGETAGSVSANAGATAGNTIGAGNQGVRGLKGIQLAAAGSGGANESVLTSTGKDLKLEQGSQIVLKTVGSASTTNPQ